MNIRLLLYCFILGLSTTQGCSTFSCETADMRKLCEQIMQNPDYLYVIAKDDNITHFSTNAISDFPERITLIKQHFINKPIESDCGMQKGTNFLKYHYYGDTFFSPIKKDSTRAYIRFAFIKESGVWKLFTISTSKPLKDGQHYFNHPDDYDPD